MAIFGPMLGVAAIAGPVVGGAIVQADVFGLGWRFALAVNVPIACLALLAAWRFVPADGKSACAGGIDWVGALLIASASGLLVLPLRSEEHTSELQSLMRISYADFCLKKKHTKHEVHIQK